jgi:hypothetical protein
MSPVVQGCHLVGSVPVASTATAFRECCDSLPGRLKRIPDGETGVRDYFVLWQWDLFKKVPILRAESKFNIEPLDESFTSDQVKEAIAKLSGGGGIETGYDDAAIESYQTFSALRKEGVIPEGVKFQVNLPTILSVILTFVKPSFQEKAAPVYEESLFRSLRRIQDTIPRKDLSIQIDLAIDTLLWEGFLAQPWLGSDTETTREYTLQCLFRMISQVNQDVELGIHNCYGDIENRHFIEPTTTRQVVDRGILLLERSPHTIDYFHLQVPLSAMEKLDEYLSPLSDLWPAILEHKTELYLGLIHSNDLEGTRKRIEIASKFVPKFGVASECGWGRITPERMRDVIRITNEVSDPWPGASE